MAPRKKPDASPARLGQRARLREPEGRKMEAQGPEIGRLALRKIGQKLQAEWRATVDTPLPFELECSLARLAELDEDENNSSASTTRPQ